MSERPRPWQVKIDEDLDRRVRARAREQGRTLSGHLRYLAEQDLKAGALPLLIETAEKARADVQTIIARMDALRANTRQRGE